MLPPACSRLTYKIISNCTLKARSYSAVKWQRVLLFRNKPDTPEQEWLQCLMTEAVYCSWTNRTSHTRARCTIHVSCFPCSARSPPFTATHSCPLLSSQRCLLFWTAESWWDMFPKTKASWWWAHRPNQNGSTKWRQNLSYYLCSSTLMWRNSAFQCLEGRVAMFEMGKKNLKSFLVK